MPRSDSPPKKRKIDSAEQAGRGGAERQWEEGTSARTDRLPAALALSDRTRLSRPSPSIDSRSPTRESSARSRSSSPTKNPFDLERLVKPVIMKPFPANTLSVLPADVSNLYSAVRGISSFSDSIYPREVEAELRRIMDMPPRDNCFRKSAAGPEADEQHRLQDLQHQQPGSMHLGQSGAGKPLTEEELLAEMRRRPTTNASPRGVALGELQRVLELREMALYLERQGASEVVWNSELHGPLLRLGLRHHPRVESINVTTARIDPAFIPRCSGPDSLPASGKMVDFALCLSLAAGDRCPPSYWSAPVLPDPAATTRNVIPGDDDEADRDEALAGRIRAAADRTAAKWGPAHAAVNQTAYRPLLHKPLAVAIETKLDAAAIKARTQLGLWTAAWHKRMAAQMSLGPSPESGGEASGGRSETTEMATAGAGAGGVEGGVMTPNLPLVTLPLLLALGHEWKLMFACDRGSRIEILGDVAIGNTQTVTGIYTILAVLLELGDWIQGPFQSWIDSVFS